jgi:hypothetical protein
VVIEKDEDRLIKATNGPVKVRRKQGKEEQVSVFSNGGSWQTATDARVDADRPKASYC